MGRLLKSNGFLGDFEPGDKIIFFYQTFKKDQTVFDSSSDSGTTKVFKNNSASPITTGITTQHNFNGVTGNNRVEIDLTGYSSNNADYMIVRELCYLDTQLNNALLGMFSINNRDNAPEPSG
jgi:hypothetical protein